MERMSKMTIFGCALALGGCALFRQTPVPGDSVAAVTAKMGQPTAVYPMPGGGQEFEYTGQPFGQYSWMAHIGPDGRLTSFEQVLTSEKFATIKVDEATKDDVLRTI